MKLSTVAQNVGIAIASVWVCTLTNLAAAPAPLSHEELWATQAAPLLDRYCSKCHAGVRQKSGLDLRSLETILRGGDRGPAILPGQPDESRLIQFVLPGADPHMPSEGKKQLTKAEIDTLRGWVRSLPRAKSPLANASSTNVTWVPEYLSELRRRDKPRFTVSPAVPPTEAIDAMLQAHWREEKLKPAPRCDDRAFARRVYLDLAGRIPTRAEAETFLKSPERQRREQLVDRLLASPEYARHMRDVFDVVLMGRPRRNNETARQDHGWFAYLESSFGSNRPWNEMVRDLILARATNAPIHGASWYLYERRNNFQAMAEAIAPVAFGSQINCAQCHNHPLAWEIEQRHYWGLVAAFNRSKNVETGSGPGVAESAVGGFVQFTNLKKESQPASLVFLNGKTVTEQRPRENEKETDNPDLYLRAPPSEGQKPAAAAWPKFSRRQALADAVTTDNPRLARAFVNRVWEILMGRGLVHPVDQIDSRHRPSQPELLDWLATDFETSGYNVKRLVRAIVLSRGYQLDSRTSGRTPPPPGAFARALDKPLSAEQLLESLFVATGNHPVDSPDKPDPDGRARDELRKALVKKFPDLLPPVYNPSLEQALFWSNSPLLDDLLKPRAGNTAAELQALPATATRIEQAYLRVLGRLPDREERDKFDHMLKAQAPETGIKNLLWTLVASAEFQLNH